MTPSSVITAPTRVDAAGTTTMATDPFGRVTSLTPPGFGAFTTTYGADGQPMTAAAPNGNTTTSTYDALGRLTTTVTGTRASYGYGYNRAGSRLSEASTISGDPGNGTATLGYDALGRLTSYGLPGIRNQTNTWQEVANRDLLTVDGTPAVQAFDAANRPNTNGYAFDADGRLTARPGSAAFLEWDSLGRLVQVRVSQGGAVLATYTYDALDRLRTVERGASRIRFRYAGTTAAVSGIVDDVGGQRPAPGRPRSRRHGPRRPHGGRHRPPHLRDQRPPRRHLDSRQQRRRHRHPPLRPLGHPPALIGHPPRLALPGLLV